MNAKNLSATMVLSLGLGLPLFFLPLQPGST